MRKRTRNSNSGLLSRLSLPIFALIVIIITFFASAASYILIRVQNDHTLSMADQSMKFVYRNIWYQFDTMSNVAAFIISNPSIEGLLENKYQAPYEAVDDYFALQTNLENLSLLSLLNDFDSYSVTSKSYVVSLALERQNGLYDIATDHYDPTTGIYKYDDLQNQEWYRGLQSGGRQTEWWAQRTGQSNSAMIFSARTKTSIRDGRSIGTVIIGADVGSIQSVFSNAQLEKGYHLLLDESNQVIYSERFGFLESAEELPYVRAIEGDKGSLVSKIDGEWHRVMYETFTNGWKLLTVVPSSHFSRYTFAISAIGATTAIAALLIAGLILRRIVVRVTVPITRLVSAMQRPEVLEFKERLPEQNSGIYEVDELGQKFASMLVTLHGLIEKSFVEEMERKQLQLELLHAQINPHFLYNTLDLINCRAIMAGDQEASHIVRSLANVFRYSLNQGNTWISLQDEIRQIEAYLYIQQMMMDHLNVRILVPDELLSARIVHLTLQPLVENAIKHGFADQASECSITLSAQLKHNAIVMRVEDNGRGCDADRMNRLLREHSGNDPEGKSRGVRTGYGTLNVHRRIQLHCGEAYGLRYVKSAVGTCVEVIMPYQQDKKFPIPEVLANV